MCKFLGDIERVPFLNTFTEPFLRSNEVRTIIRTNDGRSTPTEDESLHFHYTGTSVHGRNDFNMESTGSQTIEEKSPPLVGGSTNSDVEWSEVINPGVGKGRKLLCESLL